MFTTRTKSVAVSAALAVTGLALVACSGGGSGDSNGKTTITWLVNSSKTRIYEDLAAEFEAKNPTIKVKINKKVADTDVNRANIINTIAGGSSSPDLFVADVVWTAQFAAKNLLADLSGKLDQQTLNSVSGEVLKTGEYDGKQYCMPLFTDAGILYYRSDLLKKAHLPVPTTWDQLAQEAKTLQSAGDVKYGLVYRGAPYEGTTVFWSELMADAGGAPVNDDYSQATADSDAGHTAMDFLKSTLQSGISPSAVTTFQEPQALSVFTSGDAAFMSSNAYMYGASQDPASSKVIGKVGMAPPPTFSGSGPGASGSGGGNLCVNPNSSHLAESVKSIEFLLSKSAQEKIATEGKLVPASRAAQSDPAMAKALPVLPLISKLKIVNRPALTPNYSQVSRAIFTSTNQALAGGSTDSALSSMQGQIADALKSS